MLRGRSTYRGVSSPFLSFRAVFGGAGRQPVASGHDPSGAVQMISGVAPLYRNQGTA